MYPPLRDTIDKAIDLVKKDFPDIDTYDARTRQLFTLNAKMESLITYIDNIIIPHLNNELSTGEEDGKI